MQGLREKDEDKKKIIEAFAEVMKMTRNYSDMVRLEYVRGRGEEFAVATFKNGGVKRAIISGDSGKAILVDILKQI